MVPLLFVNLTNGSYSLESAVQARNWRTVQSLETMCLCLFAGSSVLLTAILSIGMYVRHQVLRFLAKPRDLARAYGNHNLVKSPTTDTTCDDVSKTTRRSESTMEASRSYELLSRPTSATRASSVASAMVSLSEAEPSQTKSILNLQERSARLSSKTHTDSSAHHVRASAHGDVKVKVFQKTSHDVDTPALSAQTDAITSEVESCKHLGPLVQTEPETKTEFTQIGPSCEEPRARRPSVVKFDVAGATSVSLSDLKVSEPSSHDNLTLNSHRHHLAPSRSSPAKPALVAEAALAGETGAKETLKKPNARRGKKRPDERLAKNAERVGPPSEAVSRKDMSSRLTDLATSQHSQVSAVTAPASQNSAHRFTSHKSFAPSSRPTTVPADSSLRMPTSFLITQLESDLPEFTQSSDASKQTTTIQHVEHSRRSASVSDRNVEPVAEDAVKQSSEHTHKSDTDDESKSTVEHKPASDRVLKPTSDNKLKSSAELTRNLTSAHPPKSASDRENKSSMRQPLPARALDDKHVGAHKSTQPSEAEPKSGERSKVESRRKSLPSTTVSATQTSEQKPGKSIAARAKSESSRRHSAPSKAGVTSPSVASKAFKKVPQAKVAAIPKAAYKVETGKGASGPHPVLSKSGAISPKVPREVVRKVPVAKAALEKDTRLGAKVAAPSAAQQPKQPSVKKLSTPSIDQKNTESAPATTVTGPRKSTEAPALNAVGAMVAEVALRSKTLPQKSKEREKQLKRPSAAKPPAGPPPPTVASASSLFQRVLGVLTHSNIPEPSGSGTLGSPKYAGSNKMLSKFPPRPPEEQPPQPSVPTGELPSVTFNASPYDKDKWKRKRRLTPEMSLYDVPSITEQTSAVATDANSYPDPETNMASVNMKILSTIPETDEEEV